MLVEKLIIAHLVEKKNVCRLEITVYYPKRMQMLQSSGKNLQRAMMQDKRVKIINRYVNAKDFNNNAFKTNFPEICR